MKLVQVALAILLPLTALAAPCPCEGPLMAGFHHEAADGRYVTTTSIVVPAPLAEVADVLHDVPSYGTWLFTGPDGAPTLHDVAFDAGTGAFRMTIGKPSRGTLLEGLVERKRDAQSITLHGAGVAKDIKAWAFDLAARSDKGCAERTLIELKIDINYGLMARVFGGSAKGVPSLLPLAARDDLAARFINSVERLRCAGLETVVADASGAPSIAHDGGPAARVMRCRPGSLAVGSERSQAFGKRLQQMSASKKPDKAALLEAAHEAIDGTHAIATWSLDIAGQEKPVVMGQAPGSVRCDARVQPQGEGFSLAFGAGASE